VARAARGSGRRPAMPAVGWDAGQRLAALGHVPAAPREGAAAPTHGAKQFPAGKTWIRGTPCPSGLAKSLRWSFPA